MFDLLNYADRHSRTISILMYEDEKGSTILYENPDTERYVKITIDRAVAPFNKMKTDDEYILHILNQIRLTSTVNNFKLIRKLYCDMSDLGLEPNTKTQEDRHISFLDDVYGPTRLYINQSISIEKRAS